MFSINAHRKSNPRIGVVCNTAGPIELTRGRGKKSIHHHRGTPLFSVCRPTPRSQSKNSYGVYHFSGKTREKGLHHRSGKKGIHHRASDPEKEKEEGLHGGGVYFFLLCVEWPTIGVVNRTFGRILLISLPCAI